MKLIGLFSQAILGGFVALSSILLVFGSLYLSASEQVTAQANVTLKSPSTPTTIPTPKPLLRFNPAEFMLPTITRNPQFTPAEIQPTANPTPLPIPSSCPPPANWSPITVQTGDTLDSLAQTYATSTLFLGQANCLLSPNLVPGTILYVPGQPTAQPPAHCGPPPGWVFYTVRVFDTLTYLSRLFGVTVAELQFANCMEDSTIIRVGQQVYVPNVPTREVPPNVPYATYTPIPYASPTGGTPSMPPTPVSSSTIPPPVASPTVPTSVPPNPTATEPMPSATPLTPVTRPPSGGS
ncbi:MAG: LysM peptidoglycan-binding domain-containing protein [Anaerolineales bacterium]|nr:LysM peptidoglycan-binding domain-containing protein [Anaerolineales bacterium]